MGNYYRYRPSIGFGGFTLTPAVKVLLAINAALYVIPALLGINLYRALLLFLVPGLVLKGTPEFPVPMVWQMFTYMFFHAGFSHFLFNMLTLWMFGTAVEQTWGTRRFTRYYLACGLVAGLTVVLTALISGASESLYSATVGSSGAIFGLILAFGLLFPDAPVLVMFLFPMPAKYFAMLMGFIEFFFQWTQPGSGISHIAHLGGMLYGLIYIKLYLQRRRGRPSPFAGERGESRRWDLRGAWQRWKLKRARKKFEVYMRKHQEREHEDRWVH